ncbi:uncharacterized protein KY384_007796 [Bacidia gigantensis]|uniref:uncharacterized protein n=1 Tax=Bacidia gigantensis TaxID=2732470 RepID=UPI001D05B456|nr:uncharacterized protein KY384_007796 [Bacidia gigantensis]KAG8527643.1 hypothetical protein KY384_007796 [Bacidia gigantensis]
MDGLLIDSEDIYTGCNNVILQEYGCPNLPWKIKALLQGRPAPEAAEIFHAWARLPIARPLFLEKQRALQTRFFPTTRPLPGVPLLLKTLRHSKVDLALASSSHTVNFKLKTSHQESLFKAFEPEKRVLGDDPRIGKGRGKPCPDIYLLALECINKGLRAKGEPEVSPEECLVFEDSVLGVEAGRRAGMRVVWCPHPMLLQEYTGREDEVLAGIASMIEGDDEVEGLMEEAKPRVPEGTVGMIGDGWAEMMPTLEGFNYRKYGIEL